jgi:actin-related protein
MFSGFSRRLHVELCKLLGTRAPDSININAVEDRNTLTWQGGAMLSKLSNFQSMWITSSEYEEFGPEIVHRKCV